MLTTLSRRSFSRTSLFGYTGMSSSLRSGQVLSHLLVLKVIRCLLLSLSVMPWRNRPAPTAPFKRDRFRLAGACGRDDRGVMGVLARSDLAGSSSRSEGAGATKLIGGHQKQQLGRCKFQPGVSWRLASGFLGWRGWNSGGGAWELW